MTTNSKSPITIIEHVSEYIEFECDGITYEVVPTNDDNDINRQIYDDLPSRMLQDTYHIGDCGYEYEIEREYITEHPDLIRYWLRTHKDLWRILVKED